MALGGFIVAELKHRDPLLQLRLFASPMFSLAMVINFVTQFSLFGISYLLPLFLQQAHGLGAAETGLVLFPSGILSFLTMNFAGRVYNRVGPKPLATVGLVIMMLTTLALSRITASTGIFEIGALASLRGLAIGFCMMPVQTTAYNTVPQDQMARATALTNVLFRVYGSISTAVLTTVLIASLGWHGAPAGSNITGVGTPIGYMVSAFSDAFLVMAAVAVVGVVLALFLEDKVLHELRMSGPAVVESRREVEVEV